MAIVNHPETLDPRLISWSQSVVASHADAKNVTLGLTCGSRLPNDQRVIYRIAKALAASLASIHQHSKMLLCKLNVQSSAMDILSRSTTFDEEPLVEASAIGKWDQVEISVKIGNVAPESLQRIPRLLPKWKLRYHTILIDLGPIHHVPSRTIGRLCDANYVILGPESCASAQWISQYVDYHRDCGSHILGSIVASAAA